MSKTVIFDSKENSAAWYDKMSSLNREVSKIVRNDQNKNFVVTIREISNEDKEELKKAYE